MAITHGAGPHRAWLTVNGSTFPIQRGGVSQSAKRKSSQFSVAIPLSYPGAEDLLAPIGDNDASVKVLSRGTQGQLIEGEIKHVAIDYIGRVINVRGSDNSHKLHDNKTSEKWQDKKYSEIVTDLVGRVGLKTGNVVESALMAGKKLDGNYVKLSDNISFSHVIHKGAEFDGNRWYVDNNGAFQYVPLNSPSGTYSIFIDEASRPIKSDCLALTISRDVLAGKPISVTVKAWHPKSSQVFTGSSTINGKGTPRQFVYHIPNLLQDHVDRHAKSQANEKAKHEITVSATVVGDPTCNAGMGLSLSGTRYFDQTLDIETVHHDIGMNGHTTHITAQGAGKGREAS